MADEKRRLPVFKPTDDAGEDEARPPWQWAGFGTVITFAVWLPLQYVADALAARSYGELATARDAADVAARVAALTPAERARLTTIGVVAALVPLAIAALAGGFLVGRWGKGAGVRMAAASGLISAGIAAALTWAESGPSLAPLPAIAVAVAFAAVGGRFGARRRARAHGPDA